MSKRSSVPAGRVRFGGMQTPGGYLFELTGGHLCLDLANTLDERPTNHPRELLPRYEDLLSWSVQAGALTGAEAAVLRDHASRHRGAAATALGRVVTLREAIFRVFSAVAGRRDVPGDALAVLNRFIPGAFCQAPPRMPAQSIRLDVGLRGTARSRPSALADCLVGG